MELRRLGRAVLSNGHSHRRVPHHVRASVRHGRDRFDLLRDPAVEDGARLGGASAATASPSRSRCRRRSRTSANCATATISLAEFVERARELGAKLGPVLMQFGPDFAPIELPALAQFLPKLPRDIKFAVEFRHRGWINDGIIALLAEHHVALDAHRRRAGFRASR